MAWASSGPKGRTNSGIAAPPLLARLRYTQFLVNAELVDRLGALEPEQLRPLAESWAKTEEMQSFNPVMEREPILAGVVRLFRRDHGELHRKREEARVRDVEEGLTCLVRLVQRAKQSGKGVYLWCSL
jgi:hypothetical protein